MSETFEVKFSEIHDNTQPDHKGRRGLQRFFTIKDIFEDDFKYSSDTFDFSSLTVLDSFFSLITLFSTGGGGLNVRPTNDL